MSTDDVGFRPLFTRAPLVANLAAAPSCYDAAPVYLVNELAKASPQLRQTLATVTVTGPREDTIGQQALVALELVAPIGLNMVRVLGLGSQVIGLVANPVLAILAAPALFFTGRRMLQDLERALVADPQVRTLMQRATRLSERGEFSQAASILKDALEIDPHPEYRRNGDLYLQLGIAQMRAGRPRPAMVAFAQASVLFRPEEKVNYPGADGAIVSVSKRGFAELMAIASIDSFVRDGAGIDEWHEVMGDFARGCERRLDAFATEKDAGHLLGMFGVDPGSATACRSLAAKVRFFMAKMRLRGAAAGANDQGLHALITEGIEELNGASLPAEEHFEALMEQASFYAEMSRGNAARPGLALQSVRFLSAAASVIRASDPTKAARVRAEAASFVLSVLPQLSPTGPEASGLRAALDVQLTELERANRLGLAGVAYSGLLPGWTAEQRYRLAATREDRKRAIELAWQAYLDAGEPVHAMRSALRLAWLAENVADTRAALGRLEQAARLVLEHQPDPVSVAFAARYLLDAANAAGSEAPAMNRRRSGQLFEEAVAHVRATRCFTAFYLGGSPLVHPPDVAVSVLTGLAAQEYGRAGDGPRALVLLEASRAAAEVSATPAVRMAMDLEFAAILAATGDRDAAHEVLERVLREARIEELPEVQGRALGMLRDLDSAKDESEVQILDEPAPADGDGLLSDFAKRRDAVLHAGATVVRILAEGGLLVDYGPSGQQVVAALSARLDRVREHRFRIGVVGEFSTGKSTFLNALLGEAVLPASIRPTTAVVNRIRWGASPAATVWFEDGSSVCVEPTSLKQYVTEQGNPKNRLNVREVDIFYPIPVLANGAEIVDTPGLSSLFARHTEITYGLIPECDAVIVLATGRQPYGESTRQFLGDLRRFVDDKVFYILNKIDQLEAPGVEEATNFARTRVAAEVRGARLYQVSAYAGLAARQLRAGAVTAAELGEDPRTGGVNTIDALLARSGMPPLERDLASFLAEQRGLPLLRDLVRSLQDPLVNAERALTVRVTAARMDRRAQREAFTRLAGEHARGREAAERALAGLETDLRARFEGVVAATVARIPDLLEPVLQADALSLEDISDAAASARLKDALRARLHVQLDSVLADASRDLANAIGQHRVEARRVLRTLQRDLRGEFAAALSMPTSSGADLQVGTIDVDITRNVALEVGGGAFIGGVFGFVGALFGPLGWILGVVGGGMAGAWLAERRLDALREKLRAELGRQLDDLSARLSIALDEQADAALGRTVMQVRTQRDEVLAEFDVQLAVLVDGGEKEESTIHEHEARLATLQADAARVRRTLQAALT